MPFVECFAFAQRTCIRLRFRPKCLLSNASHSPKELASGYVSDPNAFCRMLRIRPKNLHQATFQTQMPFVECFAFAQRAFGLGLLLFVCIRFQVLFHSPPGVLFAFPSRYWFTIGRLRVFSLGGWSPHLQTGFHVSRPTCLTPSTTE